MPNFLLAIAFCGFVFSSAGNDTLPANGTLSNGQTLISRNRDFELGFFSPGSSKNRFLGIWYTKKPDVVVWVANRNDPVIDSQGVMMINLQVTRNGALVISRDGSIQWSSNSSRVAARNPSLRLLDTGNLVLADTAGEADSSEGSYIWQSFDYPSDTRLPGMYMVQSLDAGQDKYLTSWRSSDDPSPGDFTFYNNVFKGQMVIDEGRTTYVDPYNGSILTRLVLDQSGSIRRYTMNDGRDDWNLVYTIPKDPCDDYAKCGPNGMCRIESVPICGCLDGFEPKFRTNWEFQDWSDGCTRIRPLSCRSGDGFLELKGVKYPDMLRFWLNTSMNIGECRDTCLRKCNCTAYAQPYINNGGHGCLMWFGDLIDTRVLPGADTNQNIYIRLPVSELESIRNANNKKARHAKAIAISVAMGVLIPILTSIQFRDNCSCNAQLLRGKHDRRRRLRPFVEPHVKRCVQVGLLCVQKLAEDRPAMSSVVFMLGCEGEAAPEPNEPGFFMERSSNDVEDQISSRKGSVRATITMTELEGR